MTTEKQNEILFDALLKVATSEALKNEVNALPSEEELSEKYKPSAELDRRIRRIIIRGRAKSKTQRYTRRIRKIAAVIIIIIVTSSATLLSVEATRNAIFNAYIERFGKYTEIKFIDSTTDSKQSDAFFPEYLPEGFRKTSEKSYGNTIMIEYTDDAGIEILFLKRPADTGTSLINNEDAEYKEVDINGNTAYLFEAVSKNDNSVLLWQSDGMVFELTSQIDSDELIHIGNSIKK